MIHHCAFRPVAPRLAPLRLSKTDKLLFAYQGGKQKEARLSTTLERLAAQPSDALQLIPTPNIPFDLEQVIALVQVTHQQQFNNLGHNFLFDLKRHCRAIGFATHLEAPDHFGGAEVVPSCNIFVGYDESLDPRPLFLGCHTKIEETEEAQRGFFGDDFESLVGRSIIVSIRKETTTLGLYSLSSLIAGEIGRVKLIRRAPRVGLELGDLSFQVEKFYTAAYRYSFTHALSQVYRTLSEEDQEANIYDYQHVLTDLYPAYLDAMDNFRALSEKERSFFLVTNLDGGRMAFGQPFSVDLTNLNYFIKGNSTLLPK